MVAPSAALIESVRVRLVPKGRTKNPPTRIAANRSARMIQRSIDELLLHDPLDINGIDYYLPDNQKETDPERLEASIYLSKKPYNHLSKFLQLGRRLIVIPTAYTRT
jgi:hypothetical protein